MKGLIINTTKDLPFFSTAMLRSIVDTDYATLRVTVSRMLKNGDLIALKRGMYVTREYFLRHSNDLKYPEFISSVLRIPSYISREYVLSKHGILTEATFGITAVTLKTTITYTNKLSTYSYKTITPKLFTGYEFETFEKNHYTVATKSKALFDYLYYKSPSLANNMLTTHNMVEELRLNMDEFTNKELTELKEYAGLIRSDKLNKLIDNIIHHAHA